MVDLYRSVSLLIWWLAADIGRAAFQLVARGGIPLIAGALVFHLTFPGSVEGSLAFGVAVFLAC